MYNFVQSLCHFMLNLIVTLQLQLVVPCLHNMFMVLPIFALGNFKIGATKPIFWILVPLEGRWFMHAWA